MKNRTLTTTLLAILGAMAGWWTVDLLDHDAQRTPDSRLKSKSNRAPSSPAAPALVDAQSQAFLLNATTTTTGQIALLEASLATMNVDEIRRRLDGIDAIESKAIRFAAFRMLLDRWAELDPPGALAYAADIEDEDLRKVALPLVVRWAATDPDAAWQAALALPKRGRQREAMGQVALVLSEIDAPRALALIRKHELHHDVRGIMDDIFRHWTDADPEAARAGLQELRDSRWTNDNGPSAGYVESFRRRLGTAQAIAHFEVSGESWAVSTLLERLVREDPAAAAQHPRVKKATGELLRSFLSAAARADPVMAVAWAKEHSEPAALAANLSIVAATVAEENPNLSLEMLEGIASPQDPAARSPFRDSHVKLVVEGWANDPDLAWTRIRNLPVASVRNQFLKAFADEISERDPSFFMKHFAELYPPPPEVDPDLDRRAAYRAKEARDEHISEWKEFVSAAAADIGNTGSDPEQNARWLRSLPAELDGAGLQRVFSNWAKIDAPAAAAFYDQHFSTTTASNLPISNIAAYWAENDPTAAAAWALSQVDPRYQRSAAEYVMQRWARQDPDAASAWLEDLPPSNMRDRVAGDLVERIRDQDPTRAVRWASTMASPRTRGETLEGVLGRWVRRAPAQVAAAIEAGLEGLDAGEAREWARRAEEQQALLRALR